MPADLKLKEVAQKIWSGLPIWEDPVLYLESCLQTLVSEVRAQAMEEAASVACAYCQSSTPIDPSDAGLHLWEADGKRWIVACDAEDIRRRASGKETAR
jgi:hypothetical protein